VSDPRPAAIRRLSAAGIGNPRLDTRLLWDQAQRNPGQFEALVKRRLAREPVAYITGVKEFWSLEFEVEPGVLIPRPETETVVEQVLDRFPGNSAPLKILDLGTGSGCLLVALLKEYPSACGLGIDSSDKALGVAWRNIARHGLASRAEIRPGNWLDDISGGPWDVIVSNPPYIPSGDIAGLEPEVRDFEPLGALDGGPDGLDAVRALAAGFRRLGSGTAFVEIGAGQAESAQALMAAAGLSVHDIALDLAGIPRVVVTGLR
jgi:release factor glutamine methyltransferase